MGLMINFCFLKYASSINLDWKWQKLADKDSEKGLQAAKVSLKKWRKLGKTVKWVKSG